MALASGTRLGPYEVISAIGAGGMGEVYKARDTRLDRSVAIKILSSDVADDAERRARFEREARAVAMLDHPNVCGIFDIGHADGIHYLVMPYLEGETLAARLAKGAVPFAEAMRIAIDLCNALHSAHKLGVTHRDLKPANVFLVRRGRATEVKLLDFGLAKLRPASGAISLSTMEHHATTQGTARGTLLGTFHYMSPEQLEGRDADARSDVWALGVVIYEMITGAKPFSGESAASVIGSILKDQPPPPSIRQPLSPPALDRVIEACLAKDPDERWQSAADLSRELQWIARDDHTPGASRVQRTALNRVALAAAIIAAGAAGAAATWLSQRWFTAPPASPTRPIVFALDAPEGMALAGPAASTSVPQLAISPDGEKLIFVVSDAQGRTHLWLRHLDNPVGRLLPGTETAVDPFWAPDSERVGFFAQGNLKWTSISGDARPQVVSRVLVDSRGGAWADDGAILFYNAQASVLNRTEATGGPITEVNLGNTTGMARWPEILPGGFVLYQARNPDLDRRGIFVTRLGTAQSRRIIGSDWAGRFGSGYLLYLDGSTLMAQLLDPETGELSGKPAPVASQIGGSSTAYGSFSVSRNGVLAYTTGLEAQSELRWVDRSGQMTDPVVPAGDHVDFSLSPDQSQLAYSRVDPQSQAPDIWILNLARGTSSRVTSERLVDASPTWSPDGERLAFRSNRSSSIGLELFETTASPGGSFRRVLGMAERPMTGQPSNLIPCVWLADGRLVFYQATVEGGYGIWETPMAKADPKPVIDTQYNELHAAVSPDRRWLAYASDQSGRYEVYIQEFSGGGQRILVSTSGGMQPQWRGDGRELFYVQLDGALMKVAVKPGAKIGVSAPVSLFKTPISPVLNPYRMDYVAAADGLRFLMKVPLKTPAAPITVVVNWPALLNRN